MRTVHNAILSAATTQPAHLHRLNLPYMRDCMERKFCGNRKTQNALMLFLCSLHTADNLTEDQVVRCDHLAESKGGVRMQALYMLRWEQLS